MCAICNFKIEFGVGHPQALSVAVATRQAIERGELAQTNTDGALAAARLKIEAIATLGEFQARLEEALTGQELLALPDFYTLLIEADTWGFFHATPDGFDPDIVPELPDVVSDDVTKRSTVLVTSDVALRALLDGSIEFRQAIDDKLLVLDASPGHREGLLRAITCALDTQPINSQA
jgi:hypothetical protein